MQKRSIILLLFTIALMTTGIGTYKLRKQQMQKAVDFSLSKDKKANKINIESGNTSCSLKLLGGKWVANETIVVKPGLAEFALSKLKLLKMDYPASITWADTLRAQLKENGSCLKVYSNDKTIYTLDYLEYQGKNIVRNKKGDLYYVSVAGNPHISLKKLFPADAEAWASQEILKLNALEIEELNLSYPSAPEHSFKIINNNNQPILESADKDELNLVNISDYLLFYSGIKYSEYTPEDYDLAHVPLFVLNLKEIDKEPKVYTGYQLFYSHNKQTEKFKCALILDSQDTVLVSYDELDPLLAQKEYFLKK